MDKTVKASAKVSIRDSIKRIVDQEFPKLREEQVIIGDVVAVYDDPNGDGFGTIDVLPNNGSPIIYNSRLNATLEGITRGTVIFPKLFSQVVVLMQDSGQDSFVILCNHVNLVMQVSDREIISKVERVTTENEEDFENFTLDGQDTEIAHDGHTVTISLKELNEDKDFIFQITKDNAKVTLREGDDDSYIDFVDKTRIDIKSNTIQLVSEAGGTVEPMVLGATAAQLLADICEGLEQATVSTAIGTQPLINIATFTAIKNRIDDIKSTVNFLQ
ncbi:MAG: hypothetical protein AAF620_00260 [Bacteroidota bacterium]